MAPYFAQNEIPAHHSPPGISHSDPKRSSLHTLPRKLPHSPAICTKHVKQHIHMSIFTSGLLHVAFKSIISYASELGQFSLLFLTLYSLIK